MEGPGRRGIRGARAVTHPYLIAILIALVVLVGAWVAIVAFALAPAYLVALVTIVGGLGLVVATKPNPMGIVLGAIAIGGGILLAILAVVH